MFAAFFQYFDI